MKSFFLKIATSKVVWFALAFMVLALGGGGHAFAQTPVPVSDIIPATWTTENLYSSLASLLAVGIVFGILLLVMSIKLFPRVVAAFKRLASGR